MCAQSVKISYEIECVRIVRQPTIAVALQTAGFGRRIPGLIESFLSIKRLSPGKEREAVRELAEVIHEPLWGKDGEAVQRYERIMAIASIEGGGEMLVCDFYRSLREKGYFPGSISEDASYLALISSSGIDAVLHLGTRIFDEMYHEQRLLVRRSSGVEFVPFFPAQTKIKSYYFVPVVKEEEKTL